MVANSSPIMNANVSAASEVRSSTRLLGLLGMVLSPCFFVMITGDTNAQGNLTRVGAFAGLLFTIGWFLTGYVIFQGGGFTKRA